MGVPPLEKLFVEDIVILDPAISKLLDDISLEGVYTDEDLDDISELATFYDRAPPEMKGNDYIFLNN